MRILGKNSLRGRAEPCTCNRTLPSGPDHPARLALGVAYHAAPQRVDQGRAAAAVLGAGAVGGADDAVEEVLGAVGQEQKCGRKASRAGPFCRQQIVSAQADFPPRLLLLTLLAKGCMRSTTNCPHRSDMSVLMGVPDEEVKEVAVSGRCHRS